MKILKPITNDGRTGFDQFGQLVSQSLPDKDGAYDLYFIHDVRDKVCYICGKTWGNTTEELADQYVANDLVMHKGCLHGVRKYTEKYFWENSLITAGFLFKQVESTVRYPASTPWYQIEILCNDEDRTPSGYHLVVGRRKRVWELRFHKDPKMAFKGDLAEEFEDVNDTKGYSSSPSEEEPEFGPYFYVHAYKKEQVLDYLRRFHLAIPLFHLAINAT